MKKKYIAPGLTVASFRSERGYASSGIIVPTEQINLMINMAVMQEEENYQYHNSIQDFTTHNDWQRDLDDSFWQ